MIRSRREVCAPGESAETPDRPWESRGNRRNSNATYSRVVRCFKHDERMMTIGRNADDKKTDNRIFLSEPESPFFFPISAFGLRFYADSRADS